jgi:hypothetical protein
MEKMPIDKFGFYSLLEPYVLGYYEVGQPKKAKEIYDQLEVIYQEKLLYFSSLKTKEQIDLRREIYTDMERYRALVNILLEKDHREMAEKEANQFNGYIKLFPYLYSPDEGIDVDKKPQERVDMSIPLDSTLIELIEDEATPIEN